MAIFLAQFCKVKFLCTRQFQNKIEESVYSLLKTQIERFGVQDKFTILNNKIICHATGSEFLFYGLWRHIDEIKSLEGVDICWIEEAHNLTEKQWKVLEPTIRKEGSQFWIVFNPQFSTDFVYKRFVANPPPNTIVRQINYTDNPFLTNTMKDVIDAAKDEDIDEYQHIYLGMPRDDDDGVIIQRRWIEAAIDAHINLGFEAEGATMCGYDVADSGADKNAMCVSHGVVVDHMEEWKGGDDELVKSITRVRGVAESRGATITYDSIGVGASVGSNLNDMGYNNHHGFNAGSRVIGPDDQYSPGRTNKDMFSNIKAQAWWQLADRFKKTYKAVTEGGDYDPTELISICSDLPKLEQLKTELCTPKRDFDKAGKVKVESKEDLAKRDIMSPNLADAFVMCFAPVARDNLAELLKIAMGR